MATDTVDLSKRRGSEYEILESGHPAKTLKHLIDAINSGSTDAALQMLSSDALVVYHEGDKEEHFQRGTLYDLFTDQMKPQLTILGGIEAIGARGEGEVKLSNGVNAQVVVELGEGGKIDRMEVVPAK